MASVRTLPPHSFSCRGCCALLPALCRRILPLCRTLTKLAQPVQLARRRWDRRYTSLCTRTDTRVLFAPLPEAPTCAPTPAVHHSHQHINAETVGCSVKNTGGTKAEVFVDVSYFSVTHSDTAAADGMPAGELPDELEPASQVHLTQVHDLVVRIGGQLNLIRGEQRHYRRRYVSATYLYRCHLSTAYLAPLLLCGGVGAAQCGSGGCTAVRAVRAGAG